MRFLLSLLWTNNTRIGECQNLLDLSDDLGVLDDCGALFDPGTTKDDGDCHHGRDGTDKGNTGVGGGSRTTTTNIRVGGEISAKVFTGVVMLVTTRRRS